MKITDGQTILFTGDSITDCGRARPVGRGDELGSGYVSLMDAFWGATRPECQITVLNTGIGGNRVIDLESRWESDVIQLIPDWLSIMIGINDVWRQHDAPNEPDQVPIERYERIYRILLEQTRKKLKGLVLMSPYIIEPDKSDPMRAQMDNYAEVVKKLAEEYDAVFINVQAAFDRYLECRSYQSLCEDRIHPNLTGHMIIARSFLSKELVTSQ